MKLISVFEIKYIKHKIQLIRKYSFDVYKSELF